MVADDGRMPTPPPPSNRPSGEDDTGGSSSDNDTPGPVATGAVRPQQGESGTKKVSCQPCREAKVKCIPSSDPASAACSRCIKLERECFYRTHKRGRKPGKIKLQQILRRLELLDRTLHEIRELNREVGDADATSLIETLLWQLHRSKFFSKENSTVKIELERRGAASPLGHAGSEEASGRSGGGTPAMTTLGMGVESQKSRSDFNMLVDMEDHASVARVPDEFPTLSNPLKLLAQASSEESERRLLRRREELSGRSSSGFRRQTSLDADRHASSSEDEGGNDRTVSPTKGPRHDGKDHQRKRPRSGSPSPPYNATSALASSARDNATTASQTQTQPKSVAASTWASTYFSRGAFHPVYDNRQEFDPIDQGLLTVAQATRLLTSFYDSFGTFMHIFDPMLSTITYIRKHSAFLLTVICALSAEFEASSSPPQVRTESAALAVRLRAHYESMIAWITSGDYKNVEMAQAFYLLASYRPMSDSAMSDQTWLFLGTAIRIATELGCNLVCYSYGTIAESEEKEHYQRQLRNTERLWLNLWNLEKTLASQTGQRMHLADEGVIATCSRWHRMPCALKQDEALVAQVELRRIMIAQGDHFNTHVLRSLGARRRVIDPNPQFNKGSGIENETDRKGKGAAEEEDALSIAERDQLSLQLSYFRNSVHMDLKRWEERWLSAPTTSHPSTSPTPLQITGPLSLDYAALVTYALPLPISYSVDVTPELAQLYRHCYISCTNYMATFIDRSQRRYMDHVTNSTVVSTVYAVVFALDLARKQQRSEGNPTAKQSGVDFGFVSRNRVLNLARLTARELEEIGGARSGRVGRSIASKYSVFLKGVLERFGLRTQQQGDENEDERGEWEGERERVAVQRGFTTSGFDALSSGRHLGRDHTHPLTSHMSAAGGDRPEADTSSRQLRRDQNQFHSPQAYTGQYNTVQTGSAPGGKAPGTKASHIYSSNIHFSQSPHAGSHAQPIPIHMVPATSTGGGGGGGAPPRSATSSSLWPTAPEAGGGAMQSNTGNRLVPPPHHHPYPHVPHTQPGPVWDQGATPAAALSPATWFNHLHHPTPTHSSAQTNVAAPAGAGGGALQDDPHWEWMMKDLDFFNADGGGGGGEPILDQMGRLFG